MYDCFIELLNKEVKPALGCTEPIAVALAVAKAVEILEERFASKGCCIKQRLSENFVIDVEVSGNILKNGMGVGIPGTGMVGLDIAAALGAVCGRSEYKLEVLHDLCKGDVERAIQLVNSSNVKVKMAETDKKLYVKATVKLSIDGVGHCSCAKIENDHDNIVETSLDMNVLSSCDKIKNNKTEDKNILDYNLSVKKIWDFANNVDFEKIKFILQSKDLNLRLAEEGLHNKYGLRVGKTIYDKKFNKIFGTDFMSYAMALTAAASDARMAGCTLPAMSNSGSGNQGITVTMPVIAYYLHYGKEKMEGIMEEIISEEKLARALALSHLIAIHIKGYLGKLSALCGCVIASTGASCGLVYLNNGSYEQVCFAIKNMIGNITGMVCDGAKVGCAMKVASGVSSAIQSAVLAYEDICISSNEGIIEDDIEKTIQNLGRIGSIGMQTTDNMILDIMSCK